MSASEYSSGVIFLYSRQPGDQFHVGFYGFYSNFRLVVPLFDKKILEDA
jgi:hypothetical protein